MLRELVVGHVKAKNQFPAKNGVSDTMSPNTIVLGEGLVDYNTLKLAYGAFAMVFEDNDPTNTMRARTTPAIALNPTGNAQGDYHFMSLITGAKLSRHQWTEMPLPDWAVQAVRSLPNSRDNH
jgi:hypothetical protein